MSKRETMKVDKKEYMAFKVAQQISKEDMQRIRLVNIETYKRQIGQIDRAIQFKKDQITKKEFLEACPDFVDGKKPAFFLQNEIENSEAHIEQLKEQIKGAQEEYDKAAKEMSSDK